MRDPSSTVGDQQRGRALQDAVDYLRRARSAVAGAVGHEHREDRRDDLVRLHSALSDHLEAARRLQA